MKENYYVTRNVKSYTINACRSCNSKSLIKILSLGNQYVSNFVDDNFMHIESERIPLELVLCDAQAGGCGLLQLRHTTSRELLYRKYWFRSGLNETMIEDLVNIARSAEKTVKLQPNDIILDLGCNDGTLLRSYKSIAKLVGFEPATNLIREAKIGTTKIINDFFSFELFQKNLGEEKCKIITSIAMFYDLENPNEFVSDVTKCLHEKGIWIIQMAYLHCMLNLNAFDNIGHEHLEYYSLKPLRILLERHNLNIFKVELNQVYGGSIRVYVKHKQNNSIKISKSVNDLELKEEKVHLQDKKIYYQFSKRVLNIKQKLYNFIKRETEKGKIIYAYGASTKGNTLLQFCNLNSDLIKKVADRDPLKWKKKTIGTKIPIVSEAEARTDKPDYFLILPWHLVDYFKKREHSFLDTGGKFIVPIPTPKIISSENEIEL